LNKKFKLGIKLKTTIITTTCNDCKLSCGKMIN